MASSTTRQTLDEAYPGLSSEDAIAGAADDGRSINKYADPIEGARFGLTAEEADEVAASDPSLLWVEECDDDDDDDDDDEDAPHCESGTVTGNRCGGAPTERLHVVLLYERGTGETLGHCDGLGQTLDVCEDCAEMVLETEGRWAWRLD